MYNWSTDEKKIKIDKEKFALWKLEQMINFGLGGDKIRKAELSKYWSKIEIDQARRKFLSIFINDPKHSN